MDLFRSSPLPWDLLQNLNIQRAAFTWRLDVTGLWIMVLLGNGNVVGEPGTPQNRQLSFVFLDLHDIQDESVSNQLSKQMQSLVPTQLKSFMSVKSFRYGAISMLMWDPAVTYEECIAIGGWSSSTNSDWYTWTYLIAVIPAVLTLSGYPDC